MKDWPLIEDLDLEAIKRSIVSSSMNRPDNFVDRFERLFAEAHSCKYGVTVTNGTHGLEVAYHALGLQPGDEVLVPAFTFIASASSLWTRGIIPVPVDVDDSFAIDPRLLADRITEKTRAILVVHIAGFPAKMDEILDLAKRHCLLVIEDCAQSHGARYTSLDPSGRSFPIPVGSRGDISMFSFQSAKVMSGGEGGIVLTNHSCHVDKILPFMNYGRSFGDPNPYNHFAEGTNFRMTEMSAAMLIPQMEKLAAYNGQRGSGYSYLCERLAELDGLAFQGVPVHADVITHSLFFLGFPAAKRTMIMEYAASKGFRGRPAYPLYYETGALRADKLGLTTEQQDNPKAKLVSSSFVAFSHLLLLQPESVLARFCVAIEDALGL